MTDRDTLIALLNSWVTVTNPHGAAWSGRLLALGDRPCVDIEDRRGHRMCLPQEFDIQRAEEPEPLCHCGHRRDRHTPRPGIGWPLAACDDCPGDEERAWRHPFEAAPAPASVPVAADGTLREVIAEALRERWGGGLAAQDTGRGDRIIYRGIAPGEMADAVLPVIEAHYAAKLASAHAANWLANDGLITASIAAVDKVKAELARTRRNAEDRAERTEAAVRDVIADMEHTTGARHWTQALTRALDPKDTP